jgi:hypothetical protein
VPRRICLFLTALLAFAAAAAVRAQPKAAEKAINNKSGGTPAANASAVGDGKKSGNANAGPNTAGNPSAVSSGAKAAATDGARGPDNVKPAPTTIEKGNDRAKGPNENASDNAKAIHAALDKFKVERTKLLEERTALLEKLKKATEEEKKVLLEQLRLDSNAREEEQRALARQVREELKKARDDRKGGN